MSALPPLLRDHFLAPRQVGDPAGAPGRGRAANAACGDELELGLWPAAGRVGDVRYRARACSAVIAAASLVAEALLERDLAGLEALDVRALLDAAGGLPPGKEHAARVVERALQQALDELRARYP